MRVSPRTVIAKLQENDLLTYASAIGFQILSALVPLALFAVALMGFLNLEGAWNSAAEEIEGQISPEVFAVLDKSVREVLESKQVFWLTLGLGIATWQLSGAMRAVMGALDRVYEVGRQRGTVERLRVSVGLALGVAACLLGALAVVRLGPGLIGNGVISFIIRHVIAIAMLGLAVGAIIRFAPGERQPVHWVGLGSGLVVGGWVVMSTLFWLYLQEVAEYESIFGGLATVFVLTTYLYLSSIVFVTGVQVDALVRDGAEDEEARHDVGERSGRDGPHEEGSRDAAARADGRRPALVPYPGAPERASSTK